MTIQVTSTNRVPHYATVFNILDFDAQSDTFTDNTTPIQNAINAAQAVGGTVFIPEGTYLYTSLTISKSGVSLMGAGGGASILQTKSGSEGVISLTVGDNVNTCADVFIQDIQFTSTNQKTSNACIKLQKCFRTHIDRVRLQNQYRGIHVYNSTATYLNDLDLRDLTESGIVYESQLGKGYDLYLNAVLSDNPDVVNNGSGILWLGGENLVIQNCDFEHYTQGLNINPPTGQQCRFGFFINSEFDTCSDNGMKISSGGGDIVGLTFTNMWSGTATNYGVLIDGGSGGLTQGIRYIGGKVFHNGLAGFRVAGGTDIHISDCDVIGNSQSASNTRHGIEISAGMASNTFSVVNCRSTNGYQQGSTQANGVNFDSAVYTNGRIVNNDVTGNSNQGVVLNGATGMVIRGNQGHNPVGHITSPTLPASTVAYTNVTGYDCAVEVSGGTVTVIAIGGTTTGRMSGMFRVPAGQTITITYSVAPSWIWFGD